MDTSLQLPQYLDLPNPVPGCNPGIHILRGPRFLPAWALRELCPHLIRGARVAWIDAGNRFDAYGLAKAALALGAVPQRVLSRVQLARPFNAFQLVTMLAWKVRALGLPVVLSDALGLFYDDELPLEEARRAFQSFLACLPETGGPLLCLLPEHRVTPERNFFTAEFLKRGKDVLTLEPAAEGFRIARGDR